MTSTHLLHERDGGVLTLTLNRPDKLNAIHNPLAEALLDALNAAATDADVRAIRLRGSGRAFCAGRDVSAAPTDRDLELVQAQAWGLVHRCVPADELDAVSLAAAQRIASLDPEVASTFKRVLNQIGLARFDHAIEEESKVQRQLGGNDGLR